VFVLGLEKISRDKMLINFRNPIDVI